MTIIKDPEMRKRAVKKFIFVMKYVPDQNKTEESFIENGEMLGFTLDCYKDQKMCSKAADNYTHALKFAPK